MSNKTRGSVSRRDFFKQGAAVGAGATTLAGQAAAQGRRGQIHFEQVADVVIVGAGASGLPAAIMAREQGASVIVIDSNHDIGGHVAADLELLSRPPLSFVLIQFAQCRQEMRNRPFKQCRLCLEDKLLCDSHLFPAAAWRLLLSPGAKGPRSPMAIRANRVINSSRQLKDYLLCECCETHLRENGEDWFLANCYRNPKQFLIREHIAVKAALVSQSRGTSLFLWNKDRCEDFDKLCYFGLGIFWKAAVHTWRTGKESINLDLGPYADELRRFLMGETPLAKGICLCIRVSSLHRHSRSIVGPDSQNAGGFHCHHFRVLGVSFTLYLGEKIPQSFSAASAMPGGCIALNPAIDQIEEHRLRVDVYKAKNGGLG